MIFPDTNKRIKCRRHCRCRHRRGGKKTSEINEYKEACTRAVRLVAASSCHFALQYLKIDEGLEGSRATYPRSDFRSYKDDLVFLPRPPAIP